MMRRFTIGCWCFCALLLSGCFDEPRMDAPEVDEAEAARAALTQYDTDGDGAVAGAELNKAPSLKQSLPVVDKDGDQRLTTQEIESKLKEYKGNKTALFSLNGQIRFNKAPLDNATVTLIPEKFMGEAVKPAKGVTNESGLCTFSIEGEEFPGTHVGFFRIEVSKINAAGAESLPPRFNSASELGGIIGFDSPLIEEGTLILNLSGP